ncbi:unnamed protein product [Amoebophrya sp. A120]|nr:unnamed protein product [Amoebophrya sp. A120]|eukprot:GSA120T00002152001.1
MQQDPPPGGAPGPGQQTPVAMSANPNNPVALTGASPTTFSMQNNSTPVLVPQQASGPIYVAQQQQQQQPPIQYSNQGTPQQQPQIATQVPPPVVQLASNNVPPNQQHQQLPMGGVGNNPMNATPPPQQVVPTVPISSAQIEVEPKQASSSSTTPQAPAATASNPTLPLPIRVDDWMPTTPPRGRADSGTEGTIQTQQVASKPPGQPQQPGGQQQAAMVPASQIQAQAQAPPSGQATPSLTGAVPGTTGSSSAAVTKQPGTAGGMAGSFQQLAGYVSGPSVPVRAAGPMPGMVSNPSAGNLLTTAGGTPTPNTVNGLYQQQAGGPGSVSTATGGGPQSSTGTGAAASAAQLTPGGPGQIAAPSNPSQGTINATASAAPLGNYRRFAVEHNNRRRLFRCCLQDTNEDVLDTIKQAFGLFHVLSSKARIRLLLPQTRETLCSLRAEALGEGETYQLLIYDPEGTIQRGISNPQRMQQAAATTGAQQGAGASAHPAPVRTTGSSSQAQAQQQESATADGKGQSQVFRPSERTTQKIRRKTEQQLDDAESKSAAEVDDSNEDTEIERSPDGRYIRYKGEPRGGPGSFNRVNMGYDSNTGRQIAWNVLDHVPPNKDMAADARREQSEWVVHGLASWENAGSTTDPFVVITGRGSSHTIRSHITRLPKERPLKLAVVRKWARDLAEGLQFFLSFNRLHGNVSMDNVFVKQNTGNIFLGDPAFIGKTPLHTATEKILNHSKLVPESRRDVIGYGLCVTDIVYKAQLGDNVDKLTAYLDPNAQQSLLDRIQHESLRDLLKACLVQPSTLTAAAILEHAFFHEPDENDLYCEVLKPLEPS